MIWIEDFAIDASIREVATYESLVAEDPIETGSDITDHVRNKKPDLVIDAVVTDSPIGAMVDARNTTTLPTEDALAHLLKLRESRQPFTVLCNLGLFGSVVFKRLVIPRDPRTGAALGFTATLKQIEIVDVERTTVRVSIPRTQRKEKRGTKATKENATAADIKAYNALWANPFTKDSESATLFSRWSTIATSWAR